MRDFINGLTLRACAHRLACLLPADSPVHRPITKSTNGHQAPCPLASNWLVQLLDRDTRSAQMPVREGTVNARTYLRTCFRHRYADAGSRLAALARRNDQPRERTAARAEPETTRTLSRPGWPARTWSPLQADRDRCLPASTGTPTRGTRPKTKTPTSSTNEIARKSRSHVLRKSRISRLVRSLVWDFIDQACVSHGRGKPEPRLGLDSPVLLSVSLGMHGMSAVLRCVDRIR